MWLFGGHYLKLCPDKLPLTTCQAIELTIEIGQSNKSDRNPQECRTHDGESTNEPLKVKELNEEGNKERGES